MIILYRTYCVDVAKRESDRTHARTYVRTYARTHAHTHARTHIEGEGKTDCTVAGEVVTKHAANEPYGTICHHDHVFCAGNEIKSQSKKVKGKVMILCEIYWEKAHYQHIQKAH